MTVRVDPVRLDGYAAQLERNSEFFVSPLRTFCATQCAHTKGMTGVLAAAKPTVELARDGSASLLASGERNLFQVATNLRAAASNYRAGDEAAAERIWLTVPRQRAPDSYADRDDDRHYADFRDPCAVELVPPRPRTEFHRTVEEATQHIGAVDGWLRTYVHVSLGEHVLPWISGDWDTLRANADGYAALSGPDGVLAIRGNLAYGMDSLSPSWDSEAATEFAFTIRDRWLPAIDTLAHFFQLQKEALECMAQESENTLHALVLLVEVLKMWVIEKVLRIVRLAGSLIGVGSVRKEIMELVTHVVKVWHLITTLVEALRLSFEAVLEAVQLAGAEATMIEDLWLVPGGNRLDPITVG